MNHPVKHLPEVEKGDSDWRTYRSLKLENGVTCVLVHDKESKHTAMATTIDAGASCDPRSLSGLAHFTEHMCFLGSKKYPGENEYKRYLSCHGGHSNASTAMGYTTYKFDVLADHAEKAIDIFSNFFMDPLFTQSGTNREVNAVDSENSKNLIVDGRRRLQILKALADPTHHYSKFSTGNAITLPASIDENDANIEEAKKAKAADVREALLTFHRRHYCPENIFVVCVGPQSLDTLQEWVVPRYASIKDRWNKDEKSWTQMDRVIDEAAKDAPSNRYGIPPPPPKPAFSPSLQENKWPFLLTTLPLKSVRNLYLNFPLPPVRYQPDRSPLKIISFLLGNEGPGSSFAVLQDAGLLTSLSSGPRISASDQCLFQLSVTLTEEGEKKWKEVVSCLFSHCRLIHEACVKAQSEANENQPEISSSDSGICGNYEMLTKYWKEIITLNHLHFNQTSPGSAYGLAPNLSTSVLMNGTQKAMSADSMLQESNESLPLEELVTCSTLLNPDNCFLERCSPKAWEEQKSMGDGRNTENVEEEKASSLFGFKNEQWYDIEYHISEIDNSDVNQWKNVCPFSKLLHLPKENSYIPNNLELCPDLPEEARSPQIDKIIDPPNLVIEDGSFGRLWHRLDDRYALPKSSLTFFFRNSSLHHTKNNNIWQPDMAAAVKSSILFQMFNDAMAQQTYDASLAGLYWSFTSSSSGMTLNCTGYSQKLSELALQLFHDFFVVKPPTKIPSFLQESYFNAAKDRTIRAYKSHVSKRADAHAMEYTNLLLTHHGLGKNYLIELAESITFASVVDQYNYIKSNPEVRVECLYSGNVSEKEAKAFFSKAHEIIQKRSVFNEGKNEEDATMKDEYQGKNQKHDWIPGPLVRRLIPCESIDLHFQSENTEEQNGAVMVTYQSPISSFRGHQHSSEETLHNTAAIRLISRLLKEPLFDELRTKQQLGYIVQSWYTAEFSMKQHKDYSSTGEKLVDINTAIDGIVILVLSRRFSPIEVSSRIDEFLSDFRKALVSMPASEITNHSDALRREMLKPIKNLGTEVGRHFNKIFHHSPEVLGHRDSHAKEKVLIPWDATKDLASAMRLVTREDLLRVWDNFIAGKRRSRIVSHVYGNTFPLRDHIGEIQSGSNKGNADIISDLGQLLKKRLVLPPYNSVFESQKKTTNPMLNQVVNKVRSISHNKKITAAFLGMGTIGICLYSMKRRHYSIKK